MFPIIDIIFNVIYLLLSDDAIFRVFYLKFSFPGDDSIVVHEMIQVAKDGTYFVADGNHRVLGAALAMGAVTGSIDAPSALMRSTTPPEPTTR